MRINTLQTFILGLDWISLRCTLVYLSAAVGKKISICKHYLSRQNHCLFLLNFHKQKYAWYIIIQAACLSFHSLSVNLRKTLFRGPWSSVSLSCVRGGEARLILKDAVYNESGRMKGAQKRFFMITLSFTSGDANRSEAIKMFQVWFISFMAWHHSSVFSYYEEALMFSPRQNFFKITFYENSFKINLAAYFLIGTLIFVHGNWKTTFVWLRWF